MITSSEVFQESCTQKKSVLRVFSTNYEEQITRSVLGG